MIVFGGGKNTQKKNFKFMDSTGITVFWTHFGGSNFMQIYGYFSKNNGTPHVPPNHPFLNHFNRVFHCKTSILFHFGVPPFLETPIIWSFWRISPSFPEIWVGIFKWPLFSLWKLYRSVRDSKMGVVWEAYHKGVPLLWVPENPID